jgi:X-Pro dipeptidyl-peptidase
MPLTRTLLAALSALLLLPAAARAETVYETLSIPTVDGDRIHVEVARPADGGPVPVILTFSPYNSLAEGTSPNLANDDLGQRYGPQGYARAVADVLGTRNSSGCWDYGGRRSSSPAWTSSTRWPRSRGRAARWR